MAGQYCLGAGFASTAGLNLQHSLLQRLLNGRLLDPSLGHRERRHLRIAEIPCGTCLWLLDLAPQVHSSTRLDGFDINLSQGPPSAWLPSAISVSKLDLFHDPPNELAGRYDIVHVSLVVCFVDDNQIEDIVRRMLMLLKPGGHIEWLEFSIGDTEFLSPDPAYTPVALPKAVNKLWEIIGWTSPEWPRRLNDILSAAGLDVLSTIRPAKKLSLGRAFADGELLGMEPIFATAIERMPNNELEKCDLQRMAQEAVAEVTDKGVGCFPSAILVTARKPI